MKRSIVLSCLASLAFVGIGCQAEASRPLRPPRPPRAPVYHAARAGARETVDPNALREIKSGLGATTERAEADLRIKLREAVSAWLAEDGVARDWIPPKRLLDRMVQGRKVYIEPVTVKDLNVFRASVSADFSDRRKHEFLDVYGRQVGGKRLALLGGGLAFVLACLAAVSGYIRADEATKGYYTNRLRLIAAAGVGAAGVVAYQILT